MKMRTFSIGLFNCIAISSGYVFGNFMNNKWASIKKRSLILEKNIRTRILLCILAILGFPLSVYSAHKITGNVIDVSQNPIPMATIRLLQPDSSFVKGTVTDNNGIFDFENIKKGNYILSVSCIGYVDSFSDFSAA